MSYCDIATGHPFHGPYHDEEYGFPVADDDALFERLVLEINQAGLSWLTILKKRENFRAAFAGFDIDRVARFTPKQRERLMTDEGIIRNRLKIDAAIENARRMPTVSTAAASWPAAWRSTRIAILPWCWGNWRERRSTAPRTSPSTPSAAALSSASLPTSRAERRSL